MVLETTPELIGKTPVRFRIGTAILRGEVRDGVFAIEAETADLNGFPTEVRIFVCTFDLRTDLGVIAVLRVVTSGWMLYVSQRAFPAPKRRLSGESDAKYLYISRPRSSSSKG